MKPAEFDTEKFREAIASKRIITDKMPLRECAVKVGISSATFSRLELGSLPDLMTYIKVCKWLNVKLEKFIK